MGAFLLPLGVSRICHHCAPAGFAVLSLPEALFHLVSCCPCRTQGGVHVHENGLTVTSPVLMWVKVSTGSPVPLPSPADLDHWKFSRKPEHGSS